MGWYIFWYSQLRKSWFFSFKWRQPEVCRINIFFFMIFWIFFYFFALSRKSIFFMDPNFGPSIIKQAWPGNDASRLCLCVYWSCDIYYLGNIYCTKKRSSSFSVLRYTKIVSNHTKYVVCLFFWATTTCIFADNDKYMVLR